LDSHLKLHHPNRAALILQYVCRCAFQFQLFDAGTMVKRTEQGGKDNKFPHYAATVDPMCSVNTP
jgi:hypothetical protein